MTLTLETTDLMNLHIESVLPYLIPGLAICIPIIGILGKFISLNHEQRRWHETVRLALEKGQPLPPELLAARPGDRRNEAGDNRSPRNAHVKTMNQVTAGLINIGVGMGLFLALPHLPGCQGIGWVGVIPVCIGLALLLAALIGASLARKESAFRDSAPHA